MGPRVSRRTGVSLAVAAVVLLFVGHLPFSGWVGHNGDHFYYTAMALQFSGHSYPYALHHSALYFHYAHPPQTMNYGFLNPQVAPVIYVRTALPLLAVPFIKVLGVSGIWVPGIVCGLVTLATLGGTCRRRFGSSVALWCVGLALLSGMFTEFGFGVYTEAPMLTLLAVFLVLLPLGDQQRSWRQAVIVGVVVLVLAFVRQVLPVPAAVVAAGWLHAWWRTRRVRNPWVPFVVAVAVAAVVSSALLQRWAPYDVAAALETSTHTHSVPGLLPKLLGPFGHAMSKDTWRAWHGDRLTFVLPVLAVLGGVRLRRTAWPWVTTAALAAGLLITALDGTATHFRYLSPALPFVLVLAAVGAADLVDRLSGVPRPHRPDSPRFTARASRLGTLAAGVALLAVVSGTVLVYQPHSLASARSLDVTAARYGDLWPLKDTSGTLLCAGNDDEVWFRSASGTLYAFSGTAMARSLSAPRLLSRANGPVDVAWNRAAALLRDGISLCSVPRRG